MSEPTDIDSDEEEFTENTLIEAIENQIESDNPPAAKATFNKLTLVGYERRSGERQGDQLRREDRASGRDGYELLSAGQVGDRGASRVSVFRKEHLGEQLAGPLVEGV